MKKIYLISILLFSSIIGNAQFLLKPLDTADVNLPGWVKMMFLENPNVFEVDKARQLYYSNHPNENTPYIAYYKHWRRYVKEFIQEDGSLVFPNQQDRINLLHQNRLAANSSTTLGSWNFVGPKKHYRARYSASDPIEQISWHANMYCIDQSKSNPNVLFSGGENGGVYKTSDKGLNWQYVSLGENMVTVSSIAINPSDENDVLVNADQKTYRSLDGGINWNQVGSPAFQNRNITIWQFVHNPDSPQTVFAGGGDSLYRSTDGGNNWVGVYKGECQSIALNPFNSSIVYALRYDNVSKIANFYKSIDSGLTFTIKPNGWFSVPTADAGLIQSYGGRIAVTEADTARVYVLLVGESQSTAQLQLNGQIGIYRSDDGGESWSNPHGLIGVPYDNSTHPNMMTFSGGTDTYNQIYYNTTIIASQLNADRILIGGMSMWRSDDAAATYQPVGGYIGPISFIHPDNQEFKVYKTSTTTEEVWFANDGGINYSTDFVQTHESRTNGVYGTALWGFDQGWNDDILVGGRYHNGNAARRDGYPDGEFQQLGGGEAATGYVNYSNEKKTYFSDINGVVLPDSINGIASQFNIDNDPNESYVDNSSSRIMFDWDYWNVAYLGKDNKLFKSENGGSSFSELNSFGTTISDKIYWIEQSRADKNVMFAQQVISNVSKLWKSLDRGLTWNQITLPLNQRELNFTLSYNNADELWISYANGSNGNKVYHTIDAGTTWTNISTAALNGLSIKSMAHQFGTNGGVYLATYHGQVFYRNNSMPDWSVVGTDLPFISYPLRIVPFYRDNKIRLATWHLGIWENTLFQPSELVADFSADYKTFYCPLDTIKFVPHCVSSSLATYQWIFTGATPSTSTDMYPSIVYNSIGTFDVTLIVNDNGTSDTITKTNFIHTSPTGGSTIAEGFESGAFSTLWKQQGNGNGISNWSISDSIGGYSQSTHSMRYNNWGYDAQGLHDAIWTAKYDFTNLSSAWLKFDVAYSLYGGQYSDTLELLSTADCGQNFTSLYLKGGQDLASAPSNSSTAFVPTSTQWRTDSVDLTSLAGNSEVIFSFVNIGRFGQILYVDNLNMNNAIYTNIIPLSESDARIFPNPFIDDLSITVQNSENYNFVLTDVTARVVFSQTFKGRLSINTSELPSGVYIYEIKGQGGIFKSGKLVKQ